MNVLRPDLGALQMLYYYYYICVLSVHSSSVILPYLVKTF